VRDPKGHECFTGLALMFALVSFQITRDFEADVLSVNFLLVLLLANCTEIFIKRGPFETRQVGALS